MEQAQSKAIVDLDCNWLQVLHDIIVNQGAVGGDDVEDSNVGADCGNLTSEVQYRFSFLNFYNTNLQKKLSKQVEGIGKRVVEICQLEP